MEKKQYSEKFEERIDEYKILLRRLLNSPLVTIRELNNEYKTGRPSPNKVEGVYLLISPRGVVYAGRTNHKTIIDRVGNQHVYGGSGSDLRDMLQRPPIELILNYKCKFIEIKNVRERSLFENFVISILNPKLNFKNKK